MNGELIKRQDRWDLYAEDGSKIGSSAPNPMNKLSLKNCEAIENGYDLVELFDEVDESIDYQEFDFSSFKLGFKKAIEILGDKKFSEDDMRRALSAGLSIGYGRQFEIENKQVEIDSYIKSLQQTEWDVEIEMDFAIYPANLPKEGEERPAMIPKLDADGCLILKRKI